jgi:LysR family transcriptional regulator for bpeEF and oprC
MHDNLQFIFRKKPPKMDRFRAMEVFISVYECGSFRKSANSLGVSNSTVTERIKALESFLGVTLIQRNSRRLHLTDEGLRYYNKSVEILREVDRAESEIKGSPESFSGVIHVEATVTVGETLIFPLIASFLEKHKNISVSFSLINTPRNMIEYGTDVAIRLDYVDSAENWARPIYDAKSIICATPEFVENRQLPENPGDLDPTICLGVLNYGQKTPRRWQFTRDDDVARLAPTGQFYCSSTPVLIHAATKGIGIINVLDILVGEQLKSGQLIQLYPEWKSKTRTYYAVTPSAGLVSPKVRAFMRHIGDSYPSTQTTVAVKTGGVH